MEDKFYLLLNLWKEDTRGISSSSQLYSNRYYIAIIALGYSAIPYILVELDLKTARLFYALKIITGGLDFSTVKNIFNWDHEPLINSTDTR